MEKIIILINILVFIFCSNRNLKEARVLIEIDITIKDFVYKSNIIGKHGTLVLNGKYPSEIGVRIIDTKRNFWFNTIISDKYEANCGLWKPENEELYIFCDISNSIPKGEYNLILNNINFIYKGEYLFTLKTEKNFPFTKLDSDIIDLYSDKQIINLEENIDSYNLKFKIISYNQEKVFINYISVLDNCKQVDEDLICPISKSKLIEIITPIYDNCQIEVLYLDNNNDLKRFALIPKIKINYNLQKKDIFVGIKKLVENVSEQYTFIAYETNITDIDNIIPDFFESFQLKFENEKEEIEHLCNFRKYENTPLLIICEVESQGTFWLKNIEREIKLEEEINMKYNFRIQPVKINEKIYTNTDVSQSYIYFDYPEILDFTQNFFMFVEFFIEEPQLVNGLTFNEEADDLTCENVGIRIKRCIVPRNHFQNKESGYYFIKRTNHLNKKSFSYESRPIKVILPKSIN